MAIRYFSPLTQNLSPVIKFDHNIKWFEDKKGAKIGAKNARF